MVRDGGLRAGEGSLRESTQEGPAALGGDLLILSPYPPPSPRSEESAADLTIRQTHVGIIGEAEVVYCRLKGNIIQMRSRKDMNYLPIP